MRKGEKKGSRPKDRERENSGPSRSYTGTATARDDNMLRSTKSSQNEGERAREREEVQPPLTTMRHFIINSPVAPPSCARPQSEIQIKHANICVFYSRGFVGRPRFVTCSRSAQSLIRFVINTSAVAANYLLRVRGRRRGQREKERERGGRGKNARARGKPRVME